MSKRTQIWDWAGPMLERLRTQANGHLAYRPTANDPFRELLTGRTVAYDSVADLKADCIPGQNPVAQVLGYYAPGDGGAGMFYWDEGNTDADDEGMTLESDLDTDGRWIRVAPPGFYNVRWFGIGTDAGTANALRLPYNMEQEDGGLEAATAADTRATTILQDLLTNKVTPQGLTLYFPAGLYRITSALEMPRSYVFTDGDQLDRETAIIGDGPGQSVIRADFAGHMFVWEDVRRHARARFEDIALFQYAWSAGTIKHESTQAETDRLQLFVKNVRCEHLGTQDTLNTINNVHLEGLLGSTVVGLRLGGGSGGAGNSGLPCNALYLSSCSESVFEGVHMSSGVNARGLYVGGGGDLVFNHVRLDAGSRGATPGFHFYNTKFITINGLRSETGDANPSVKFEGCQAINVIDMSLGGGTGAYNLVKLVRSKGINFYGGYLDDKYTANGVAAMAIDANSDFVRIEGMRTVKVAQNIDLQGTGQTLDLDVWDSDISPFFSDPADNFYYRPSRRVTSL